MPHYRRPTEAEQMGMARAYLAGRTLREAGALYGFSAPACRTALLKHGVARRTRSEAQKRLRVADRRET
jgi:hypothetical protein